VPSPASITQAPPIPGFLTIRQGETPLLDAAVHFADTREADFTACGRSDTTAGATQSSVARNTKPDPLWRVWILLLVAALLVSWKFSNSKLATA
jgi:hypothetical protein